MDIYGCPHLTRVIHQCLAWIEAARKGSEMHRRLVTTLAAFLAISTLANAGEALRIVPEAPSAESTLFVFTDTDDDADCTWTVFRDGEELATDGFKTQGSWLRIDAAASGQYVFCLSIQSGNDVRKHVKVLSIGPAAERPAETRPLDNTVAATPVSLVQPAAGPNTKPIDEAILDRLFALEVHTMDNRFYDTTDRMVTATNEFLQQEGAGFDETDGTALLSAYLKGRIIPVIDQVPGDLAQRYWKDFFNDVQNTALQYGLDLRSAADERTFVTAIRDALVKSKEKREEFIEQAAKYLYSIGYTPGGAGGGAGGGTYRRHHRCRLFGR